MKLKCWYGHGSNNPLEAVLKNVVANFLCEYKEEWDKPTNRGLLKVIRQINSHETQEIQLNSEKVSGGNVQILPLKPLVSECAQ